MNYNSRVNVTNFWTDLLILFAFPAKHETNGGDSKINQLIPGLEGASSSTEKSTSSSSLEKNISGIETGDGRQGDGSKN